MSDHPRSSSENSSTANPHGHTVDGASNGAAMEARVRRLEDAVALLQDTSQVESRLVEQVVNRLGRVQPDAHRDVSTPEDEIDRPREPDVEQEPRAGLAPFGGLRHSWLPFEIWHELRDMVHMFLDRGYRVGMLTRVLPIAALVLYVISWIFFSGIWLVGPIFDRLLDVVLISMVYKTLSREADRYRQALANPSPGRRV